MRAVLVEIKLHWFWDFVKRTRMRRGREAPWPWSGSWDHRDPHWVETDGMNRQNRHLKQSKARLGTWKKQWTGQMTFNSNWIDSVADCEAWYSLWGHLECTNESDLEGNKDDLLSIARNAVILILPSFDSELQICTETHGFRSRPWGCEDVPIGHGWSLRRHK